MEAIFGPTRFTLSYSDASDLNLILPIKVEWVYVNGDNPIVGVSDAVARERWGIWRNQHRNSIIANRAREFVDDQVLIIVRTLEHAVYLKQCLPEYTLVYAESDNAKTDIEWYKSKSILAQDEAIMTNRLRSELRDRFRDGELRKVISTHVWDTGVDFPQLGVIIRADALATKIKDTQTPGRVCRKCPQTGKQFGLVVDFVDLFDAALQGKSMKRRRAYVSNGWEQMNSTFSY